MTISNPFKKKLFFIAILSFLSFCKPIIHADLCRGKIDVAPAYVHIDILESGHTVSKIDMAAFRADANIRVIGGFCIKPNLLLAASTGNNELCAGNLSLGHCFPVCERWLITPSVGYSFTNLKTHTDIPFLGLEHIKERFRSYAPIATLEITYKICQQWRASASFQYSWSKTHTIIKHIVSDHSKSKGPAYGILLERDFNDKWSVNVGAGYNISLSKEKHGLRGYGVKVGLVYWL